MRRRFGPDIGSERLRGAHESDGVRAADMLDIDGCARMEREHTVAGNENILCDSGSGGICPAFFDERRMLFMEREREIQSFGAQHGLLYEQLVEQRDAVIRESAGSERSQLLKIRQILPGKSLRDGRGEADIDRLRGSALDQVAQRLRIVGRRFGVRHADDCREPSGCSRARAGVQILLPGKAGIAEMDMDIDKAGRDDARGGVEHRLAVLRLKCTDRRDPVIFDSDIAPERFLAARRQDCSMLNQHNLRTILSEINILFDLPNLNCKKGTGSCQEKHESRVMFSDSDAAPARAITTAANLKKT